MGGWRKLGTPTRGPFARSSSAKRQLPQQRERASQPASERARATLDRSLVEFVKAVSVCMRARNAALGTLLFLSLATPAIAQRVLVHNGTPTAVANALKTYLLPQGSSPSVCQSWI